MTLSRAHTSTKAANVTKLLLLYNLQVTPVLIMVLAPTNLTPPNLT